MPVLIDGNNLLHAVRSVEDPDRLYGRFMLNAQLGRWAERVGDDVHVVYDGPEPSDAQAEQLGHSAIRATYSGAGVKADDVLFAMLEMSSAARLMLVVSSDGEVRRAAKRRRARVLKSDEFWALLKEDLARPPRKSNEPEEKRQGLEPGATNQWLREFGFEDGTASDDG